MKFEMTTVREIRNDEDGSYYEIGPDADGLGLVQISHSKLGSLSLPPALARMIAKAFCKCADELEETTK